MRWRIPLVAVLALFVAASCDQAPTALDQTEASTPSLQVITNEWIEYPWVADVCGETVDAWLRTKIHEAETVAASGNYMFKLTYLVKGTAVGRTTGYTYVWNDTWRVLHETGGPLGYPYSFVTTDNWNIIGKGQAPNFTEKVTAKFTINANGDVTADHVNFHSVCN